MKQVILASGSPRRRELLSLIVKDFSVEVSDFDETAVAAKEPCQLVQKLAAGKCQTVACGHPAAVVIGSDTVVDCKGSVLGKPASRQEALEMLRRLSGSTHLVHTGVAIAVGGKVVSTFCETAKVHFCDISAEELEAYVDTPEPYDKAGGYAIQGQAALWCTGIEGDYYTIMGLPVCRLNSELKKLEAMQ